MALHKLVFEQDGDRGNRQRLREFRGFEFSENSEEFNNKLEYAARLSIADLTSICNVLGLDYTGDREALRIRIIHGLMDLNSLVSNDDTDSENDGEGSGSEGGESENNEVADRNNQRRKEDNSNVKFTMSLKDVEESIRPFNGSDSYSIERWILDFEDAAGMFKWTDLQKVVFAKKSLDGLAKLFIQGENGLKTWKKLKGALLEEFTMKVTSIQLHKMLEQRKIKKSESVQEYFLVMKELFSRGTIELKALFEYVIAGLCDDSSKTIVLRGAKTIRDFKEKLKIYETIMTDNNERNLNVSEKEKYELKKKTSDQRKQAPGAASIQKKKPTSTEIRCYNCGVVGHRSRDCGNKSLGTKCFKCNLFGHVASQCLQVRSSNSDVNMVNNSSTNDVFKDVLIENVNLSALFDTGSNISMIREDVISLIKSREIHKLKHTLFK